MTKVLESKLLAKDLECEELVKYQEEFRDEYVKVCGERDEFERKNQQTIGQRDYLEHELKNITKENL